MKFSTLKVGQSVVVAKIFPVTVKTSTKEIANSILKQGGVYFSEEGDDKEGHYFAMKIGSVDSDWGDIPDCKYSITMSCGSADREEFEEAGAWKHGFSAALESAIDSALGQAKVRKLIK